MSSDNTFYNIKDYNNVSGLLKTLAGLGVLSLGAGVGWGGLNAIRKRALELMLPTVTQPSKALHKDIDSNRISVTDAYFPAEKEGSVKTAASLVDSYRFMLKSSGVAGDITGDVTKGVTDTFSNWLSMVLTGSFSKTVDDSEVGPDGKFINYRIVSPKQSIKEQIIGTLASKPGLRPLWFLPSAVGAAGLGFGGGMTAVKFLDSLLGKPDTRMLYQEKAKKIYEQSAKYLNDVASGKIKLKKKDDEVKSAGYIIPNGGDGTSSFINPMLIPGILLAGLVAKQLKGFSKGVNSAEKELADRTHMLWAAEAARKERDYDYNGLQIDLEDEPYLDAKSRRLNSRTKNLRNSVTDDNNYRQLKFENEVGKERRDEIYE